MIRFYTYYSCGGYKDMYLGTDDNSSGYTYYLPLLPIWIKNNKPSDADKIAKVENLKKIGIITNDHSFDFPSECEIMFSHGGYKAIYKTLSNGQTCFCIHDILNGSKDEENRDIPFNFLVIAEGLESIKLLDNFANRFLLDSKLIELAIGSSIKYDYEVNGIRFDIGRLTELIHETVNDPVEFLHKKGNVVYILIDSRKYANIALKEQNINDNQLCAAYDQQGLFYGALPLLQLPEMLTFNEETPSEDSSNMTDNVKFEYQVERPTSSPDISQEDDKIANEEQSEIRQSIHEEESSIELIRDIFTNLQLQVKQSEKEIKSDIIKLQSDVQSLAQRSENQCYESASAIVLRNVLHPKYISEIIALIVGLLLGALLF